MGSLCFFLLGFGFTLSKIHALGPCDNRIVDECLARPQLRPTPLQFIAGKTFWKTASTSQDLLRGASKIYYAPLDNQASEAVLKYYTPEEVTVNITFTEHLGLEYLGYVLNNDFVGAYSFFCSEHLVAVYQCQKAGRSPNQKFLISATLDIEESLIKEERELCKQTLRDIDNTATFTDHHNPDEVQG